MIRFVEFAINFKSVVTDFRKIPRLCCGRPNWVVRERTSSVDVISLLPWSLMCTDDA